MTEEMHVPNEVPVPTNGNGRIIKIVWGILGFVVTIAVSTIAATNYFSNSYVSKEIYATEKNTLSTQIDSLAKSTKELAEAVNNLKTELAYMRGRSSK